MIGLPLRGHPPSVDGYAGQGRWMKPLIVHMQLAASGAIAEIVAGGRRGKERITVAARPSARPGPLQAHDHLEDAASCPVGRGCDESHQGPAVRTITYRRAWGHAGTAIRAHLDLHATSATRRIERVERASDESTTIESWQNSFRRTRHRHCQSRSGEKEVLPGTIGTALPA